MDELQLFADQSLSPIYYTLIEHQLLQTAYKMTTTTTTTKRTKVSMDSRVSQSAMQKRLQQLDVEHTASHLAKAQGILHQLEHLMTRLGRSFCVIPNDILTAEGLSQEDLLSGCFLKDAEKLRAVGNAVLEVNAMAAAHLDKVHKELLGPSFHGSPCAALFLPWIACRTKSAAIAKQPLALVHRPPSTSTTHFPLSNLFKYFMAAKFNKWHF